MTQNMLYDWLYASATIECALEKWYCLEHYIGCCRAFNLRTAHKAYWCEIHLCVILDTRINHSGSEQELETRLQELRIRKDKDNNHMFYYIKTKIETISSGDDVFRHRSQKDPPSKSSVPYIPVPVRSLAHSQIPTYWRKHPFEELATQRTPDIYVRDYSLLGHPEQSETCTETQKSFETTSTPIWYKLLCIQSEWRSSVWFGNCRKYVRLRDRENLCTV